MRASDTSSGFSSAVAARGNTGLPPWQECLLFAVPKRGEAIAMLVDDERYQPVLR
jgi:hypothetical protein